MIKERIIRFLCAFVPLTMLIACNSNKKEELGVAIYGYDDPVQQWGETLTWSDFHCIGLEQPGDGFFTSVQRIDYCDSLIIIQDLEGLYAYNQRGQFLYKYGEKGHGQNEYVQLSAFCINSVEREIHIIDSYSSKVISYDIGGYFLDSSLYPFGLTKDIFSGAYVGDGKLFTYHFVCRDRNVPFMSYSSPQNELTDVVSFDMSTSNSKERFGYHPYMVTRDGSVNFVKPFDNIIYTFEGNVASPAYNIITEMKKYTKKEMKKMEYTSTINFNYEEDDNIFLGFTDVFETPTHILLNSFLNSQFLIDKSTMTGQRYRDYVLEESKFKSVPLMNICALKDDFFVGFQTLSELSTLEFEENGDHSVQQLQSLIKSMEDEDDDRYVLLFYRL